MMDTLTVLLEYGYITVPKEEEEKIKGLVDYSHFLLEQIDFDDGY